MEEKLFLINCYNHYDTIRAPKILVFKLDTFLISKFLQEYL